MKEQQTSPIETLTEIRQLMERSSRFISLSGLSGVFAGSYALIGAYFAYKCLNMSFYTSRHYAYLSEKSYTETVTFLVMDAILVFIMAIGTGIFLTTRKAKKDGNSIFDKTALKLVLNLCIPLGTGGLFCLAMLYHGIYAFVAPSMLIFYGLSLVNASKYTLNDIRFLGIIEIGLGLLSALFVGYGLLFLALGFGVMHILYGLVMYFKYEK